MVGYFILGFYILGVILCSYLVWKINKKRKTKLVLTEIMMDIYMIFLSWVGILSMLAGHFVRFNKLDEDKN